MEEMKHENGMTSDIHSALFLGLANRREWLEARLCENEDNNSINNINYINDEIRKIDEAFGYLISINSFIRKQL